MSDEPPPKRVRKGTRSCVECRHRKIKCIWPSERAPTCQNCLARGRPCEQQVFMTPTADMVKVSSRARIAHLEGDVGRLWSAVQNVQTKLGIEISKPSTDLPRDDNDATREVGDDDGDESERSESSPVDPPTHLLKLFDNRMLGADSYDPFDESHVATNSAKPREVSALRKLMPRREDIVAILAHASSWLALYNSLFPVPQSLRSSEELIAQYDRLQGSEPNILETTALLLSVTLTVQQAPAEVTTNLARSIKDCSSFVRVVSDTVERLVVYDDNVASSIEGIETTLLFIRLQLGRGRIRKMWLLLRRVIAIAQLLGLPRASAMLALHAQSGSSSQKESPSAQLQRKALIWDSLCAIDRIGCMMWSLPLATGSTPPPRRPILDASGKVVPQAFLHTLADVSSRVLDLDSLAANAKSLTETFNVALGIDQELRSLSNHTPKGWWRTDWPDLTADAMLQYWYTYLTVRAHLQLALIHEGVEEGGAGGQGQFLFSFTTCTDAARQLGVRYTSMRGFMPVGFFANPIMDLQALTAGVFLVLTSPRSDRSENHVFTSDPLSDHEALVNQMIARMDAASRQPGGSIARKAASALRALTSLLQAQRSNDSSANHQSQHMTVNLPLIGRIHVSRRASSKTQRYHPHLTTDNQQMATGGTQTAAPNIHNQWNDSQTLNVMDASTSSAQDAAPAAPIMDWTSPTKPLAYSVEMFPEGDDMYFPFLFGGGDEDSFGVGRAGSSSSGGPDDEWLTFGGGMWSGTGDRLAGEGDWNKRES